MPSTSINGVTLNYSDTGRGPVVFLVHGFPLNNTMWNAQVDALSSRFRVIAPDLRGFGQSGETGPFSMQTLADDIHALAEQLKTGPFVLGALSMGGYAALAYVRKYPGTLRGLILVDTKAEADNTEGKANRDKMIATVREKGAKATADAMLPKLLPEEAIKSRPKLVADVRNMMERTRPQTIEHALAAMRDRPDQCDLLPSIAPPTLVICGEHDVITPVAVMKGMAEKIPGAGWKVITGAGHMSPMEQAGQVTGAMESFLGGLR